MSSPESPSKQPELPEGMTADYALNELSEKERIALAESQGIPIAAFNRHLQTKARHERIDQAVAQATQIKEQGSAPRNENVVLAEQAVIRGLSVALKKLNPEALSESDVERLEKEAYDLCDLADNAPTWQKAVGFRRRAQHIFEEAIGATAQQRVTALIATGLSRKDARAQVAKELAQRGTNLRPLREALSGISFLYDDEYPKWGGRDEKTKEELQSLIDAYNSNSLTKEQSKLLQNFIKSAKAAYFKGHASYADSMVQKYASIMPTVNAAYRTLGPHSTTSSNVSGPAEVFSSNQSERVSGYRRDSKARPHRDPSGGSGENW